MSPRVSFALTLSCSNVSAAAITALWDQASAFQQEPSMRGENYRPHVTFAVYDASDVTEERAIAAMRSAAEARTAVELAFDRIRHFPGSPFVLWADPEPKDALLDMHRQIHNAIDPKFCMEYYKPGNWVPHCTLAMHVLADREAEALAFAASFRGGIRVIFDRIDCLKFHPVQMIAETKLPAQQSRTRDET
jgi:2'-5' RNA ligase